MWVFFFWVGKQSPSPAPITTTQHEFSLRHLPCKLTPTVSVPPPTPLNSDLQRLQSKAETNRNGPRMRQAGVR